jgi:site-specific DNA-methyltransferase (adenine-specific)
MFSFAGDTVLDPFVGTGTTCLAAINTGRNSVGVDVEPKYLRLAHKRLKAATAEPRYICSTKLDILREGF